jgi:hypothetical protein
LFVIRRTEHTIRENASPTVHQEFRMVRQDLRAQRKQILAQNMNRTDTEVMKF